jgi:hypothetical protein
MSKMNCSKTRTTREPAITPGRIDAVISGLRRKLEAANDAQTQDYLLRLVFELVRTRNRLLSLSEPGGRAA